MTLFQSLQYIGMLFESVIIIFSALLLILILQRYFIKHHKLTLYLFLIFLSWTTAIIFSWLSKILELYSNIPYLAVGSTVDPGTAESWILFRIVGFRISFLFVTIGTVLSYLLKVNAFDREFNKTQSMIVYAFGIFTMFYSLIAYQRNILILDVFAFLFVLILISIVYIPFMMSAFTTAKSVDDPTYKRAFQTLALMSLFLILVMIMFLIDRIFILLGNPGFTIFYFLAWIFVTLAFLAAYLGYIRPKSSE
jgi:hypothetical protein